MSLFFKNGIFWMGVIFKYDTGGSYRERGTHAYTFNTILGNYRGMRATSIM